MGIEIASLEPADDNLIDRVIRLRNAALAVDAPELPPFDRRSFAGYVRNPVTHTVIEHLVAWLDGEVAGYLQLQLPMKDNPENSEIELEVDPAFRRRGVGRALHTYTMDRLRELGRKRTAAYCGEALGDAPVTPGRAFAEALGAKAALGEIRRRLDLSTVDTAVHDRMLADAWEKAAGYKVVRWRDRVPEEYIADVGYLDARLVTDAPMGDLVWEKPDIDAARIREGEERRLVRGIRSYSVGMVHEESGRMVAITALGLEETPDWHSYQWITLVDPDHRGHRLGTVAKIDNLRYALANEPALRVIDTWNADVNDHMIAINEAMGFRAKDIWVAWQQDA